MNGAIVTINGLAIVLLLGSLVRDRARTWRALKSALRSARQLASSLISVLIVIGLMLGFVSQDTIGAVLGEGSGVLGVLASGLLGSVMHIPALVAFPLGASLMRAGASTVAVAVFITTLTMVGFVTIPLEIRILGRRFAIARNALSLVCAILIGLLVGVIA